MGKTGEKESVWDYPRPPRMEKVNKHIQVIFEGKVIADTRDAYRVLETSHPPTYYIPPKDVKTEFLHQNKRQTLCEYKGTANYYNLRVDSLTSENAAWSYHDPSEGYRPLKDQISFYPSRVDACYVDNELVFSQEGDFYGGWITSNITGPFKGSPGTEWW